MNCYGKYKVTIPEGKSGPWEVEKFEVSDTDVSIFNLRAAFHSGCGHISPGTYTRLTRNGSIVMSDTPSEIRDHLEFIFLARGRVLIAGLGLGMVASKVCAKDEVEHVTVIEKSPDVIALVGPTLLERFGDKLEIIEADIFEWKPGKGVKWNVAWYDVWDSICLDNLPQMTRLHRKFGRRVSYIQASWRKGFLEAEKRRKKRNAGRGW